MMPTVYIPTPYGDIAVSWSAGDDHPNASVDFRPAGETGLVPLSYTELDGDAVVTRVWADAGLEDPTHRIVHAGLPDARRDGARADPAPEPSGKPPVVYVCAPYKGATMREREQNVQNARMYAFHVLRHGGIPYAAHLAVCGFLDDSLPAERQAGIAVDHAMMELCDECWVFGNVVSPGMKGEIDAFLAAGKTVRCVPSIDEAPGDSVPVEGGNRDA